MNKTNHDGSLTKMSKLKQAIEKEKREEKLCQTSLGAKSVCELCGKEFNQLWLSKQGEYAKHKKCPQCRAFMQRKTLEVGIPYEPHPGQQLVHESKARFRVIAAGARWGKDRCCMMEFIQKLAEMLSEERGPEMVPAVLAWFVAPTYKLAWQLWREFKTYFPREWVVNYWETNKTIETVNDGFIEIHSADDPDSLVGVGLDMLIITEAARISRFDEVWANLEMRLLSPGRGPGGNGGIALINGTPKGSNFYHRMFRWGQKDDPIYDPDWESWSFPSWSNPYLSSKDKKYLERLKKRFPKRVYDQEVLAKFLAGGNSVFPKADICATYAGESGPVSGEMYTIGYDPAKEVDYSGVIIRNSLGQAVSVLQWTGVPWTSQVERIVQLSRYYNYAQVNIDKTGVGETLPSMLRANGVIVQDFHLSNIEKERLVNHLAMLIEQEIISYPDHEVLLNELKDYQYSYTKTGKISFSASSDKHDDLVTALYLAFSDYNLPGIVLPFMGKIEGIKKKKRLA